MHLSVFFHIKQILYFCYIVTIECRSREMVAYVRTTKVFNGKVYVKSRPNSCVTDVLNSMDFEIRMAYHDLNCDVKQQVKLFITFIYFFWLCDSKTVLLKPFVIDFLIIITLLQHTQHFHTYTKYLIFRKSNIWKVNIFSTFYNKSYKDIYIITVVITKNPLNTFSLCKQWLNLYFKQDFFETIF